MICRVGNDTRGCESHYTHVAESCVQLGRWSVFSVVKKVNGASGSMHVAGYTYKVLEAAMSDEHSSPLSQRSVLTKAPNFYPTGNSTSEGASRGMDALADKYIHMHDAASSTPS